MTELELYFEYRCEKGLKERGLADKKEYQERLAYEIKIIKQMGYVGYFLIVSDFLTWALNNDVLTGPGRGSGAGSLVAYILQITHLDPIKYGLVFERFLNPERNSMPDFDCDFDELQRHKVINYVRDKYGHDKVAHIGTYGSMKAKGAIRDVTRTLGLPYGLGDKLAKLTLDPIAGKPQPLAICYEKVPQLKKMRYGFQKDPKAILEWAEKIENRLRSFGTHASGIVISRDKLSKKVPLYPGKDGAPTTQFEMYTVEESGLIKFDFLGLRALTTISRCVKSVAKRYGITIDPLQIPVDDEPTYKLLQAGKVNGLFQLESSQGMRDLLIQIRPTSLEDIGLLVAVYRPGPLSSPALKHYLKVRAGDADPHYTIPELKPILKSTDGLLIFQESILEICKQLAGYSLGEADLMRRAVGKKDEQKMAAQYSKFIAGMQAHGISQNKAKEVWQDIEAFAAYGFNRAHAMCYGYITYQMAWLKTHYPLEFMCSCLISDSNEVDKVIQYISACKEDNIEILGPSINESQYDFDIDKGNKSIRFGLSAIKNLGKPVKEIIQEREENGPFKNIVDFASRVDLTKINKRKLESLVLAGAFDDLNCGNRMSLMGAVENILAHKEEVKRYQTKLNTYNNRMTTYGVRQQQLAQWMALSKEEQREAKKAGKRKPGNLKMPDKPIEPLTPVIPIHNEMLIQDKLNWEKELLGFFVSGHPLDNIKEKTQFNIRYIKEKVYEGYIQHKTKVRLIAIPSVITPITTKKDKLKMAYVTLEDKTGTIQGLMLPPAYAKYQSMLDVKIPALYDADLEVIEADLEKSVKLIITKMYMLKSVQEFIDRPIELTVDLTDLSKFAHAIKKMKGNGTKVQLTANSKGGNTWHIGNFKCNGNRNELEAIFKELE